MKNVTIDGEKFNQYSIKFFAVEGNPNNKVWGRSKKEAQAMAPGKKLVFLQSETKIEKV